MKRTKPIKKKFKRTKKKEAKRSAFRNIPKNQLNELRNTALKMHPHLKRVLTELTIETLLYHVPDDYSMKFKKQHNIE